MILDGPVKDAILDFASFLGTRAHFSDDGACAFRFAQSGLFSLCRARDNDDIVVTLSRLPQSRAFDPSLALSRLGEDMAALATPVSVAMNTKSELVVATRLTADSLTLQAILRVLDLLKQQMALVDS